MRQIFVDSRDRIAGSPQSFSIQLRDTLVTTAQNYFRIDNMRIPLVIPRIQTGVNDRIYFSGNTVSGGAVRWVTLTQGTYSGTDMAAMIHSCFYTQHPENPLVPESTDSFWAAAYFNTTAGMSISCLIDPTFTLLTDAQLTAKGVSPAQSFCSQLFTDATSQVTVTISGTTNSVSTWYFPYVSMVAVDLIYIASSKLSTNDTFGPSGASDTLACLVTSTDFASVLTTSMPAEVWLPCPVMSTQQIDFQVRDRAYNLLTTLPNWSATVTIR